MSRFMQIDIRLIPFYETPFKKAFPRLAGLFREYDYTLPLERDVSLYDLVDYLEDMLQEPRVATDVKDRVRPHAGRLRSLKETAREQLLGRRLNDLDDFLYRMEDEFVELEKAL